MKGRTLFLRFFDRKPPASHPSSVPTTNAPRVPPTIAPIALPVVHSGAGAVSPVLTPRQATSLRLCPACNGPAAQDLPSASKTDAMNACPWVYRMVKFILWSVGFEDDMAEEEMLTGGCWTGEMTSVYGAVPFCGVNIRSVPT